MRLRHLAIVVACEGVSATAGAQSSSPADAPPNPPITWCSGPVAANVEWARQSADLTIAALSPRDSVNSAVLKPHFALLLDGIVRSFLSARYPIATAASHLASVPSGEPRYAPNALASFVSFDLLGDGSVDSVQGSHRGDSTFTSDLDSAIEATVRRGDTFGPYGSDTLRTRLTLFVTPEKRPGAPIWPAFTIYAPIDRPAQPLPGNSKPRYPDIPATWRVNLLYTFIVDETGRVAPLSIRNTRPPDKIVWEDINKRAAYERFTQEVERVIGKWRFVPAQVMGCHVAQLVQQPLTFTAWR